MSVMSANLENELSGDSNELKFTFCGQFSVYDFTLKIEGEYPVHSTYKTLHKYTYCICTCKCVYAFVVLQYYILTFQSKLLPTAEI